MNFHKTWILTKKLKYQEQDAYWTFVDWAISHKQSIKLGRKLWI